MINNETEQTLEELHRDAAKVAKRIVKGNPMLETLFLKLTASFSDLTELEKKHLWCELVEKVLNSHMTCEIKPYTSLNTAHGGKRENGSSLRGQLMVQTESQNKTKEENAKSDDDCCDD